MIQIQEEREWQCLLVIEYASVVLFNHDFKQYIMNHTVNFVRFGCQKYFLVCVIHQNLVTMYRQFISHVTLTVWCDSRSYKCIFCVLGKDTKQKIATRITPHCQCHMGQSSCLHLDQIILSLVCIYSLFHVLFSLFGRLFFVLSILLLHTAKSKKKKPPKKPYK